MKTKSVKSVAKPVDARGEEDLPFKDVGARTTEHGEVRPEAPRHDFVNATSHELGESGVPSREPKSDMDLLHEIIGKISEPVAQPPTTDAAVLATYNKWFREDAPKSLDHPFGHHGAHNRKLLLQYIEQAGDTVTRESLTAAARTCPGLMHLPQPIMIRDLPGGSPAPLPEVEKPKRGRPPKVQPIDKSAPRWKRRELGLSPRQLVKHMKDARFNPAVMLSDTDLLSTDPKFIKELERIRGMEGKHYDETIQRHMNELKNKLPLKEQRLFTDGQIRFYKDYASGKFSDDELAYVHGASMVSGLISLENDIVDHLIFQKIIKIHEVRVGDGSGDGRYNESLEHAWDLEAQAIANGSADGGTIIGSKYKHGLGKSFSRYGLDSFDVGWQTKFRRGGGESGETGPAYSDDGDDREPD